MGGSGCINAGILVYLYEEGEYREARVILHLGLL